MVEIPRVLISVDPALNSDVHSHLSLKEFDRSHTSNVLIFCLQLNADVREGPFTAFEVAERLARADYKQVLPPNSRERVGAESSQSYSRRLAEAARASATDPLAPVTAPPPASLIAPTPIVEEDLMTRSWHNILGENGLDEERDATSSRRILLQSIAALRYSTFLQTEAGNAQVAALKAQEEAILARNRAFAVQDAALQKISLAVAGTPAEGLREVLQGALQDVRDLQVTQEAASSLSADLRRNVEVSVHAGGSGGQEAADHAPASQTTEAAGPFVRIPLPAMDGKIYRPTHQAVPGGGKIYLCPWVDCSFNDTPHTNWNAACSHIRAVHTRESFRCPFCGDNPLVTSSADVLRKHVRLTHPGLTAAVPEIVQPEVAVAKAEPDPESDDE